jgi:hypothetical protein
VHRAERLRDYRDRALVLEVCGPPEGSGGSTRGWVLTVAHREQRGVVACGPDLRLGRGGSRSWSISSPKSNDEILPSTWNRYGEGMADQGRGSLRRGRWGAWQRAGLLECLAQLSHARKLGFTDTMIEGKTGCSIDSKRRITII